MYCKKTQCLTLVNYSTALKRKVLLLGYSEKAVHHDVIGQFGMEDDKPSLENGIDGTNSARDYFVFKSLGLSVN